MNAPPPVASRRILFVYDRVLSSFIARDWDIVSRRWPPSVCFRWSGWHDLPRLAFEAARCDLVFCWFGAAHALASVWATAGRQSVVIMAGGWDVARLPDIGYGAHTSLVHHYASRLLFGRARRVLAVSEFTRSETIAHARVSPEKVFTIFHGFDAETWAPGTGPRTLDVVTVSGTHAMVKGIDLVIDTATRMPGVKFEIVGPQPGPGLNGLMAKLPTNLQFVGRLSGDAYREKLQSARVCFQPSRQESFGCAVAEAMLSGCIPVVARRGALPEVLGGYGHLVDRMLPSEFERAIQRALAASDETRQEVRERIAQTFPLETYAERLTQQLEESM